MSHMIFVQAEVDEVIKSSAERLLEEQGYVPADAIRLFYEEVVARNGLPFAVAPELAGREVVAKMPVYEEFRAQEIRGVLAEVSARAVQGDEMLNRLLEYKARRAARKAARKLGAKKPNVA